jgi:hypothetical protein
MSHASGTKNATSIGLTGGWWRFGVGLSRRACKSRAHYSGEPTARQHDTPRITAFFGYFSAFGEILRNPLREPEIRGTVYLICAQSSIPPGLSAIK